MQARAFRGWSTRERRSQTSWLHRDLEEDGCEEALGERGFDEKIQNLRIWMLIRYESGRGGSKGKRELRDVTVTAAVGICRRQTGANRCSEPAALRLIFASKKF